jgi:uncharacterized protein YbbK (DUF523 family)/uncharacterized protein YbgA (DUF1722 family)
MQAQARTSVSEACPQRPRVGISACLLGERVRYDGGHKRDRFLSETLSRYVEWVPVCPELELGLGVPRPPIQLARISRELRLVAVEDGADLTARMRRYARRRIAELARDDLCGFVLKQDSPSCGLERVKIHRADGRFERRGRGLFAAELVARFPFLPVEEEGRLADPDLRDHWIERVFATRQLRDLWARRWTLDDLRAFRAEHELVLLAHAPAAGRALERLLAGSAAGRRMSELRGRYEVGFLSAISTPATRARHARVLRRIAGRLGDRLDPASRAELEGAIERYRSGAGPLSAPLRLAARHARALAATSGPSRRSSFCMGKADSGARPLELADLLRVGAAPGGGKARLGVDLLPGRLDGGDQLQLVGIAAVAEDVAASRVAVPGAKPGRSPRWTSAASPIVRAERSHKRRTAPSCVSSMVASRAGSGAGSGTGLSWRQVPAMTSAPGMSTRGAARARLRPSRITARSAW